MELKLKYTIVSEKYQYELAESVNRFLDFGWKLQGGLTSDMGGYRQAMVKEYNPNEK